MSQIFDDIEIGATVVTLIERSEKDYPNFETPPCCSSDNFPVFI